MRDLLAVLNLLKLQRCSCPGRFFMPRAWNASGFRSFSTVEERPGEISVNPFDFLIFSIEGIIAAAGDCRGTQQPHRGTADLGKSVIYGMFPRMLTAWDHYEKDVICPGTLLKTICYLPNLKKFDVDIIYLLPFFEYSDRNRKGETGSPYSIRNLYRPDRNLHEPLLGEYSEGLLELEFKAFVEACHLLGIRVMVDFVFRTVSRDSELIAEHPEWFYWIGVEHDRSFSTPVVEGVEKCTVLNDRTLISLYESEGIREFLSWFTYPPNELNPVKWRSLVERQKRTGENILGLVEEKFRITTVPGFSDVLNDPQPPWTDVTYLKFYHDMHEKAACIAGKDQPPFILQDGIRLCMYHGDKPIQELWEYVCGAVPYYQRKFGIDGARIDMGHSLPAGLSKKIVQEAKTVNGDFILWSEEFDVAGSLKAKEDGFHFITGYLWKLYKRLETPDFDAGLSELLENSEIPVAAALETPDTPRAAYVHKDLGKLEMLVLINCFLPNTVQFINNGLEIMEVQPMNLGLDNTEEGRYVLDREDLMYGKLAFFDNYRLHWLNKQREDMGKILCNAALLRRSYIDILAERKNYINCSDKFKSRRITLLAYYDRELGKGIFLLANRNFGRGAVVDLYKIFSGEAPIDKTSFEIVYEKSEICRKKWPVNGRRRMNPGEVLVGTVHCGG